VDELWAEKLRHDDAYERTTEDLQHGQDIDGVLVLNPFMAGPEILDTLT